MTTYNLRIAFIDKNEELLDNPERKVSQPYDPSGR